jgi:hypothetical protein
MKELQDIAKKAITNIELEKDKAKALKKLESFLYMAFVIGFGIGINCKDCNKKDDILLK